MQRWLYRARRVRGRIAQSGLFCLNAIVLALLGAASAEAQWQSAGALNAPPVSYSFLAATPSGDILAATFNTADLKGSAADIPALVIRNPTTGAPQVTELCRARFDPQRGFGGAACDSEGNFYLSGDTGDPASCFLRRYKPDGTPDTSFGKNGEVRPNRRALGIDVFGDYLLMAVDWCQFQVYRRTSGELLGTSPRGSGEIFVRDIAVDPISLRVFGVAAGSVVVWEGGTPWDVGKYRFRIVTPAAGRVRSGEGISLDPVTRSAVITPVPGNLLFEVGAGGGIVQSVVTTADATHHLADTVVSFDGATLFISDITHRVIHLMKRGGPETVVAAIPQPAAPVPGVVPAVTPVPAAPALSPPASLISRPVTPVTWYRSYQQIVEQARNETRPMVVYFRMSGVARCTDVENSILLTPVFNQHAQKFVCVFEDIAINRLLAYRFGVFRVPHIVVLNRTGEIVATFTYNIDPQSLYGAMDSVQ